MPHADRPSGKTLIPPVTLDSEAAALDDKYDDEVEEIHGDGASDRLDNTQPGQIDGGDTDKFGIKPPDAMGAGA